MESTSNLALIIGQFRLFEGISIPLLDHKKSSAPPQRPPFYYYLLFTSILTLPLPGTFLSASSSFHAALPLAADDGSPLPVSPAFPKSTGQHPFALYLPFYS